MLCLCVLVSFGVSVCVLISALVCVWCVCVVCVCVLCGVCVLCVWCVCEVCVCVWGVCVG